MEKQIVLGGIAGEYYVLTKSGTVQAKARGKLKEEGKIIAGDYVSLSPDEYDKGKYIIEKLGKRKNFIDRPRVANIDQLVIVIGIEPKPDFYLIDKLLINCLIKGIDPLIVINKQDIATNDFIQNVILQYDSVAEIISCSAKEGKGIDNLKEKLRGKLSVFAGQSAVGKSTLLNTINKNLKLTTNTISEKNGRGRHTTKTSQIYVLEDMLIADTPGFSMLDIKDIEPRDLSRYYIDFDDFRDCKYTDCIHIDDNNKQCGIIKAVKDGKLNKERYDRYVVLYKELKKNYDKRF